MTKLENTIAAANWEDMNRCRKHLLDALDALRLVELCEPGVSKSVAAAIVEIESWIDDQAAECCIALGPGYSM
jgi:hypothetical protein